VADNTAKNVAIVGGAVALIGGLFAAFGKKSAPAMQGAPMPPKIRKGCNCGR